MNKTIKIILGIFAVLFLMMGAFAGGFVTRHALAQTSLFPGFADNPHPDVSFTLPNIPDTPSNEQTSETPQDLKTLFVPFWETWHLIHKQYVSQPVDDVKLVEGAINGMLRTLDVGLNYYQNAEELKISDEFLNGKNYEGIGAYVDLKGEYLTVISPIKSSPAAQAGVRPGDMVIAIDGESMTGVDPEEARQKVMGPAGTDVTLTIVRKGQDQPIEVTITRA